MSESKTGTPEELIDPKDVTKLVDKSIGNTWKCPHCGKRIKFDPYAEAILLTYFKLLRHCPHCGYVHCWELELTDDFKKQVIKNLTGGKL